MPTDMPTLNLAALLETSLHTFVIDASDAGFPPGHFPRIIATDAGNGKPFVLQRIEHGGECYVYKQEFGCAVLNVFND